LNRSPPLFVFVKGSEREKERGTYRGRKKEKDGSK
jgi:hypothetical protein